MLSGHGGTVFDASFSPNGTWVVTGGPRPRACGWPQPGSAGTSCAATETPVRAAAFDSERRIVTLGSDGVRAYVCDDCGGLGSLVALADKRLEGTGRELTQRERLTYLREP